MTLTMAIVAVTTTVTITLTFTITAVAGGTVCIVLAVIAIATSKVVSKFVFLTLMMLVSIVVDGGALLLFSIWLLLAQFLTLT